ncbi:MAG: tRNA pseudouridine(38-40) synthase TruA [Planktomarina sp.]
MPRYALKIEYNGVGLAGWQRQNDVDTVQGHIEAVLAKLEDDVPSIAAAGRTDAGVHALGQVAHCNLRKDWIPDRLKGALNHHLKGMGISVVDAAYAPDDWHARFNATERQYVFRLVCRRAPVTHDANLVWRVGHDLDASAMQEGANYLLGLHDFTTFRSSMCQAQSPVKTMDEITVTEHPYPGGKEIRFFLRARSFLHNQVRSIVGTLERVGTTAWEPSRVRDALEAKDRAQCGPVCPPQGLYLSHVVYPDDPFVVQE